MRILLLFLLTVILFSCNENKPLPIAQKLNCDSSLYYMSKVDFRTTRSALDTFFRNRFSEDHFSGCVLVASHGVVVYRKAYGWRDHEKRIRLSMNDAFQLASVSKQFTAAAIMLLHQNGKLNYDDLVTDHNPDFPWKDITIRHLLNHRAGLDKYTNICDNYYRDRELEFPTVFNNDSAIGIMARLQVQPFRKPNEKFDYSNTGYVVLAQLVEKISDQSFQRFMKVNFFDTLGMRHTWIANDAIQHTEKTKGYFSKWKYWEESFLDSVTGDKGVYASVGDMLLWDRALHNGTILSLKTQEEAYADGSPELINKRVWNYGFGWRILHFDDGAKAVFHNGWWHGYTSTFYRGISDDVTIIILCNKFNRGIYNTRPVLAILGAHHLPIEEEEGGGESESDTDSKNTKRK
jgi:CubicO group peptidase (beta-lactamase class C family)